MSETSNPIQRRRVIYRGRVQGVGFRATTSRLARRLGVAGQVRNLPDGTVELLVDAPTPLFDQLHEAIQDRFVGHGVSASIQFLPCTDPFQGFEITR
ncbi:acylphosphatase [Planctomicrobium sp. SH664]|uniref:acylphosphatase n=1 Tax=Planctomicrobium sp. SH664 TaxID=3448125 RepID=UPI003F5C00C3